MSELKTQEKLKSCFECRYNIMNEIHPRDWAYTEETGYCFFKKLKTKRENYCDDHIKIGIGKLINIKVFNDDKQMIKEAIQYLQSL